MKSKFESKFIAIDGPDGCGKSTQCVLLVNWLIKNGVKVVAFRDPGATIIGEKIRRILLSPEHITMSINAEVLLYMAARAQLWSEKISPALERGKCVIIDRWLSSTCAYQGYAGDFGVDNVIRIAADSLKKIWPDLTIILDVNLGVASKRLSAEPDRMEQKPRWYHKKVREGFLELVRLRKNFCLVDSTGNIEMVHEKVKQIIVETDF